MNEWTVGSLGRLHQAAYDLLDINPDRVIVRDADLGVGRGGRSPPKLLVEGTESLVSNQNFRNIS